jgi:hypothetical protein
MVAEHEVPCICFAMDQPDGVAGSVVAPYPATQQIRRFPTARFSFAPKLGVTPSPWLLVTVVPSVPTRAMDIAAAT